MKKYCVSSGLLSVLIVCISLMCGTISSAGEVDNQGAESFKLCENSAAAADIIISPASSAQIISYANDLAEYLNKISGAVFQVTQGDGSSGIVLGLPENFSALPFSASFQKTPFTREAYIIRSTSSGLYLLGASHLAVRDAVWDFLGKLGYRQFFPGEHWEYIPSISTLTVSYNIQSSPDFLARRIWYNWGISDYNETPYNEWSVRNRMVKGFDLNSGHAYEQIRAAKEQEFADHPEYIALVNGERNSNKFCISNAGLRDLVVQYAVDYVTNHPNIDSISMEPSDGDGWCECDQCAAIGTPSDRALLLANEVAEAINNLGLGDKYVGMYAYNMHQAPPHIQAHPKVVVSACNGFLSGEYTFDEILDGWHNKGATMGVYEYFSVIAWDWNLPKGVFTADWQRVAERIAQYHTKGVRFFDAEAGDAWGPYGLGFYMASKVLWDVNNKANAQSFVDDFIEKSFGPAQDTMRDFYTLITTDETRRSLTDYLARMYRLLKKARDEAAGNQAVENRIDDLIKYTHYVELYKIYDEDSSAQNRDNLLRYVYRIRESMMVHAYGIWARLNDDSYEAFNNEDDGRRDTTPVTEADIVQYLTDGIANYQPQDTGFIPVDYSKDLVAVIPPHTDNLTMGYYPFTLAGSGRPESAAYHAQGEQEYYIWIKKDVDEIHLKVRTEEVYGKFSPKLTLYYPDNPPGSREVAEYTWSHDGTWHDLTIPVTLKGLYKLVFKDGDDFTSIDWPEDLPVVMESRDGGDNVETQFRTYWDAYFYVPKGTEKIAAWITKGEGWEWDLQGTVVGPDGNTYVNFEEVEEGSWFTINVPNGLDGKLWHFKEIVGHITPATFPPYYTVDPKVMLLPKEVVARDALTKLEPNSITDHTLTYSAGAHGSVSGATVQSVADGADGTEVTAVPDAGYHFVSWSDGSNANPRRDTHVTVNISIVARFKRNFPWSCFFPVIYGKNEKKVCRNILCPLTKLNNRGHHD